MPIMSWAKLKKKKEIIEAAANYFDAALTNSSWHPNSDDARMRRGNSFFEVAKSTKDESDYQKAISSFEEIRSNTDATLDNRAESSFMMGNAEKILGIMQGQPFSILKLRSTFQVQSSGHPNPLSRQSDVMNSQGLSTKFRSLRNNMPIGKGNF